MIRLSIGEMAEIMGGEVFGDPRIEVTARADVDSRTVENGGLFVAVAGEHVDGHDFVTSAFERGAAAVLASRVTQGDGIVVPDVIAALGRLSRTVLSRLADAVVIGVTGSQGKTSVKDLLAQILEFAGPTVSPPGSFNNELGVPLTALRADQRTRFLLVEMGARGVGHIATLCQIAPPSIGIVTSIGRAHLGEFGSVEAIARAKGELVESLPADGAAILNADDPAVLALASRTAARVVTFGSSADVSVTDLALNDRGEPEFTLSYRGESLSAHVPLIGEHQAMNAAAATAAALAAGVELSTIVAQLGRVANRSAMRMERHIRSDGVMVIDDSYNANPDSMAAGLRAAVALRKNRVFAVLGEMLELGAEGYEAHVEIGRLAAELGVDRVLAVGAGAAGIAEGAGERGIAVADVDVAVDTLSASLSDSDVVLVKASRGARLERVVHALMGIEQQKGTTR